MIDSDRKERSKIIVMSGIRLSRYFLPSILKQNKGRILSVSGGCVELIPPEILAKL